MINLENSAGGFSPGSNSGPGNFSPGPHGGFFSGSNSSPGNFNAGPSGGSGGSGAIGFDPIVQVIYKRLKIE